MFLCKFYKSKIILLILSFFFGALTTGKSKFYKILTFIFFFHFYFSKRVKVINLKSLTIFLILIIFIFNFFGEKI